MANITVVGTNYVGLVTAACLSDLDNSVVGIDIDPAKVAGLSRGQLPIFEPSSSRLSSVLSKRNHCALRPAMGMVCRARRSRSSARARISVPRAKPDASGAQRRRRLGKPAIPGQELIVVYKSTMPVGTGDWMLPTLVRSGEQSAARFSVVSNPEFLREGSAVEDLRHRTA